MAARHARESRPVPRRVQDRMDRGVAVFDLTAAGAQLEEPESSCGMGDADIKDLTDFRAVGESSASA
eukprot:6419289-Alexandrium_andersonii.AAC.1